MSTTVQIIPERLDALTAGEVTLDKGAHFAFGEGHCAMEVVSWLAGLGHTDAPECASPVLRSFTINLNDNWGPVQRQKLVPFLPRMVGTNGDGQDEARSYLALDWLIRTHTPAWLELVGLTEDAQNLRGLPEVVDLGTAGQALPVVHAAREQARSARVAAGDGVSLSFTPVVAARDAVWVAAWAAAGAAAKDAARDAARDAAGAAAKDAARDAARDAAGAAAWDAAWLAAWDAAWLAAWDAAWDAAGAAEAAAGAALQPTVTLLQASALDLFDRMIDPAAPDA